ncbi:MAG TPA: hypothetical protein VFK38_02645 [Candidatus Limnocylindrales bacterium]|nr:hypothetical protein [Candidatus Limnocylindrales bacterium]
MRQTWRHLTGRVSTAERAALASWLSPDQLALFEAMHPADQRHGLDVVAHLRAAGHDDRELLLAGLFHDAAKGPSVGLWQRIAWSLGERYGAWAWRLAGLLPGFSDAFERLRDHAERSARFALAAGCSARTAELIRRQAASDSDRAVEALRLADQAS